MQIPSIFIFATVLLSMPVMAQKGPTRPDLTDIHPDHNAVKREILLLDGYTKVAVGAPFTGMGIVLVYESVRAYDLDKDDINNAFAFAGGYIGVFLTAIGTVITYQGIRLLQEAKELDTGSHMHFDVGIGLEGRPVLRLTKRF